MSDRLRGGTLGSGKTPITNGLSVDVEDYFHAEAITGCLGRHKWDAMESRVVGNTHRVLDLLAEHNVRATFFILGWVGSKFPGLVREILSHGHEIGCHSYWHRLVYEMSPEEFREDTRQAKETLEAAAGVKVLGYRAPTFSVTKRSLWALEILGELGFCYDSSIFPTRHDFYGIPGHPRFSCRYGEGKSWNLIESPVSTWRMWGMNFPFGGGGYLRILPLFYTHCAFRRVNNHEGQPVIVYFHPWELDPDQPRIKVGLRAYLRHYTNLGSMRERIRGLLRRYEFVPLCDLLKNEYRTENWGELCEAACSGVEGEDP
jgi:polysaccharide deacetylase family protein (PEP-CTERM system associated)